LTPDGFSKQGGWGEVVQKEEIKTGKNKKIKLSLPLLPLAATLRKDKVL
jgi:hypothetical protein